MRLIPLRKSQEWQEVLLKCCAYDFHHTSCYHALESEAIGGEAYLYLLEYGKEVIALPLIIRNIPDSNYKDATSVYGYGGIISSEKVPSLVNYSLFLKSLRSTLLGQRVVTLFSRCHPLIPSSFHFEKLKGFGHVLDLNSTIFIDLSEELDIQRQSFRKSTKSEINQLRGKKGYEVEYVLGEEAIDDFYEIYTETMDRLQADSRYYFSKSYLRNFLQNDCFDAFVLFASHKGTRTATAMFTRAGSILQYHLSGTKIEFARDTPVKLLIDEARRIGKESGCQQLHLGGGVGGSDEDSLFKFKSGFSKKTGQYKIWKWVVDENEYRALCQASSETPDSSFFPAYRKS